jgi:hypothetical protein
MGIGAGAFDKPVTPMDHQAVINQESDPPQHHNRVKLAQCRVDPQHLLVNEN